MSGPIVRKSGFPYCVAIIGVGESLHGPINDTNLKPTPTDDPATRRRDAAPHW